MDKLTVFIVLFFITLSAFSQSDAPEPHGGNDRHHLMCYMRQTGEINIDAMCFPQSIKLNSQLLTLYKAPKGEDGYRFYEYIDNLGGMTAELAVRDKDVYLLYARSKADCYWGE